jgi:hypothetical protein
MTIDTREMRQQYPEHPGVHALCDEVERLRREGSPGVMHEVDRAFYELTVKERDYERHKAFRLEQERDAAEAREERLEAECQALRDALEVIAQRSSEPATVEVARVTLNCAAGNESDGAVRMRVGRLDCEPGATTTAAISHRPFQHPYERQRDKPEGREE